MGGIAPVSPLQGLSLEAILVLAFELSVSREAVQQIIEVFVHTLTEDVRLKRGKTMVHLGLRWQTCIIHFCIFPVSFASWPNLLRQLLCHLSE